MKIIKTRIRITIRSNYVHVSIHRPDTRPPAIVLWRTTATVWLCWRNATTVGAILCYLFLFYLFIFGHNQFDTILSGTDRLCHDKDNSYFVWYKNQYQSFATITIINHHDPSRSVLIGGWDGNRKTNNCQFIRLHLVHLSMKFLYDVDLSANIKWLGYPYHILF